MLADPRRSSNEKLGKPGILRVAASCNSNRVVPVATRLLFTPKDRRTVITKMTSNAAGMVIGARTNTWFSTRVTTTAAKANGARGLDHLVLARRTGMLLSFGQEVVRAISRNSVMTAVEFPFIQQHIRTTIGG